MDTPTQTVQYVDEQGFIHLRTVGILRFYLSLPGAKFSAPKSGDAGYDLITPERVVLPPAKVENVMQRDDIDGNWNKPFVRITPVKINTGVHLAIPEGYVGLIFDKSSVGSMGVKTYGGVIDSIYRGAVHAVLGNHTPREIVLEAGQKVSQLLIVPVSTLPIQEMSSVEDLGSTERGDGGFGSTGKFA